MPSTITVFEGGRLDIPPGASGLRAKARLLGISVGGKQAFVVRQGQLYATDLVGAVDVQDLKVEVLPKPYGASTVAAARELMFDVLRWAGVEISPTWLVGSSASRDADLLEIVERRASSELLERLEMGAPRQYHAVQERTAVLRGRIRFSQYSRQLPSDGHLLPVRYFAFAADNDLGRLLRALATTLRDRATSYAVRRDLDRCLDVLGGVETLPLTPELVRRVRLGRLEADWSHLVKLAGLLAVGRSPDPTTLGATDQTTLLFSMNRLFETIIRRVLSDSLPAPLYCARSPGEHRLLSASAGPDAATALAVKPDLLFRLDARVIAAGDAKWKRLIQSPPRFDILPGDVFQLLAYMRLFDVPTGLLFFPRADWMTSDWAVEFAVSPTQRESVVALAVDLSELVGSSPALRRQGAIKLASRVRVALG